MGRTEAIYIDEVDLLVLDVACDSLSEHCRWMKIENGKSQNFFKMKY